MVSLRRLGAPLAVCLLVLGAVTACGGPVDRQLPTPAPTSTAHRLVIPVTLTRSAVSPHDKTYKVSVGTTVDLRLTSDHDDVIDIVPGPEITVGANQTVPGSFVPHKAGTYRIRSTTPAVLIATLTVS